MPKWQATADGNPAWMLGYATYQLREFVHPPWRLAIISIMLIFQAALKDLGTLHRQFNWVHICWHLFIFLGSWTFLFGTTEFGSWTFGTTIAAKRKFLDFWRPLHLIPGLDFLGRPMSVANRKFLDLWPIHIGSEFRWKQTAQNPRFQVERWAQVPCRGLRIRPPFEEKGHQGDPICQAGVGVPAPPPQKKGPSKPNSNYDVVFGGLPEFFFGLLTPLSAPHGAVRSLRQTVGWLVCPFRAWLKAKKNREGG